MAKLPAPVNSFVDFWRGLIDTLESLGVDAAVAWATAAQPWLGLPVISWLFKQAVKFLASDVGRIIFNLGGKKIIAVQGEIKKADVKSDVNELKAEIQKPIEERTKYDEKRKKANESIDDFIHRGKRP